MKVNKILTTALAATLALSSAYADDFDFGSDFSFGGSDDSSSSPVEISGDVNSDARMYVSADQTASDSEMKGDVSADLNVKYSGAKADAEVKLNLNTATLKNHPEAIIDEAYVTGYMGNFKLEAGKMKNVWGKGDKLHVIDNFNADDYTDFIIPDYLDRRIATPMVKGSYAFGYSGNVLSNMKLEGVYTPFMPVDRFADSGRWTPAQVTALTNKVTAGATAKVAKAFTDYTTYTATYSALTTMNANAIAAKTAYDAANTALTNVNTVYAAVYNQLYQNALSQSGSEASAKAYADANVEAQYETYMKGLNSEYDSTYAKDTAKAKDAIAATGYDYQEALSIWLKALEETGCENLDDAKSKLTKAGTGYMTALMMANSLNANPSMIYPDVNTFKYGQVGTRFTASLGPVDLGISYYYGHYKQPSVNASKVDSYLAKYLSGETVSEEDKFLAYDQKQTFGLEAATILWHFNIRGEACYNLTDDVDGTNPWVHNNSVQWLGGFDIDLPFWNMNLNLQETGTYILKNDQITGSTYEVYDVDYNVNGYSNNKLVANLTASFKNDQILPEVTVMYGIESGDVVVLPKLVVKPTSELSLTASGMYVWCKDDNSEFAGWDKNNFVQLGASLSF